MKRSPGMNKSGRPTFTAGGMPRNFQFCTRWTPPSLSKASNWATLTGPPRAMINFHSGWVLLAMHALNTAFNALSNAACNNTLFSAATISAMHETAERMYKAAQQLKGLVGQTLVANFLGESPQTLKHWENRGVSKRGAIKIQELIGCSATWISDGVGQMLLSNTEGTYPVSTTNYKRVWVIGNGQGGLPERIWTDGDFPVGASNEFAEIASADPHAFLVSVVGTSMVPRYNPGEYALVEPGTEPDLEDDVLVRLTSGETMLKRLLSRRAGYRFGSYNDQGVLQYTNEEIVWVYYVAHPVPARKIKHRL